MSALHAASMALMATAIATPKTEMREAVVTQYPDPSTVPPWADGSNTYDEGTPDEWCVHWTLPTKVGGVRSYEDRSTRAAQITCEALEFTDGHTDEHTGLFVVLDIPTDSAERALLTPEVAERLGTVLIEHANKARDVEAGK